MQRIAELRLQRGDVVALLRIALLGARCRRVEFLLQPRGREPLAVDFVKRPLLRCAQAFLGPPRVVAQPVELGGEIRACLRKCAVAFRIVCLHAFDLRLQGALRRVVGRPRLLQFLDAHLRSQQRGRPLLQRGFGAGQFGLQRRDFRLRRRSFGLDFRAQCIERGGRIVARPIPQRRDQLAGCRLQIGRQVGMLDPHATLFPQFGPELAEDGRRRAHAALADKLVQAVRGGRDAEAEKQQRARLAVQLARFREVGLEALDFGGQAGFVGGKIGHGGFRREFRK